MNPEQAVRHLPNPGDGLDLLPCSGEAIKPIESCRDFVSIEPRFAIQAGQGGHAFDLRCPPHNHLRVAYVLGCSHRRGIFFDEQWDDRRAVPEPHRPVRRSSSRKSTALSPGDGRGGGVRIRSSGGADVASRISPARWRRSSLPDGSGLDPIGSRIATGRPRSVIVTLSPARTRSISALRPFFASLMVAIFIWLF